MSFHQNDYAKAHTLLEACLLLFRELGEQEGMARSLASLGLVALEQGDFATARALFRESLMIFQAVGNKAGIADTLDSCASLHYKEQRALRAVQLWGAEDALREAIGSPRPAEEGEEYDSDVTAARSALGEEAFATAWEQGRAMTWEQAVDYALEH